MLLRRSQRREKLQAAACNFSGRSPRPCLHEHNSCHGRNRQRRPPSGQPTRRRPASQVRAVTRRPATAAHFRRASRWCGSAAAGLRGASAVFLNSRALGDELATVVDLARREGVTRLVALSAINADDDFSRQPSRFRGDRNKEVEQLRRRLRPGVGQPAPNGVRHQLLRHVGAADQGRRRGQRPVRGGLDGADRRPRHLRGRGARAAHRRAAGPEGSADRPAGLDQYASSSTSSATVLDRPLRYQEVPPDLVRQRFIGLGFPGRVRRRLHRRFWRRRCPSPRWSPTRWRRSSAVPPQSFADAVPLTRDLFTN